MLSLKTGIQSVYEDGAFFVLEDITNEQTEQIENPEGSGNYEEVPATNLFYGTDTNPTREELALFLSVTKKEVNNEKDFNVYSINSEPETATNWIIPIVKDGWHRAIIQGIPKYTVPVAADVVVYYNGSVYRSLSITTVVPNSNSVQWAEVTDLVSVIDHTSIYTSIHDFGIIRKSEICLWNEAVGSIRKEGCEPCKNSNRYNDMDYLLQAANVAFCSNLYLAGEKAIRLLDGFCKC